MDNVLMDKHSKKGDKTIYAITFIERNVAILDDKMCNPAGNLSTM